MRAVVVDRWMEPKELEVRDVPEPEAGPGQVAVAVRAAGCNFFDILMVRGEYQVKPPFPFVPGGEIAGVVKSVGEGVDDLAPGDRVVYAAAPTGSYTSRLFTDPELLAAKLREEASELAEAEQRAEVIHEAADVLYFTLATLARHDIDLAEVERALARRALKVTRRG